MKRVLTFSDGHIVLRSSGFSSSDIFNTYKALSDSQQEIAKS